MARIVVLGGTGYAGGHIAAEATKRGHEVLAVSRKDPQQRTTGVEYRNGDVREEGFVAGVIDGADVVISALSPRGDMADGATFRQVERTVAQVAQEHGARFGVVGGAGSLLVAEGGPKLVDTPDFPKEFAHGPRVHEGVLQDLQETDEALDWFFISPAAGFGGYAPGNAKGTYRTGGEVLLSDEPGESFISGADLALAVVDEVERPAHRRARFTVAY